MRATTVALLMALALASGARAQDRTYRTRPDYPACTRLEAYRELVNIAASGDREAFGRYIADQANGCIILRGGLEVYRERVSIGISRIRLRGQTFWLYTATQAVQ